MNGARIRRTRCCAALLALLVAVPAAASLEGLGLQGVAGSDPAEAGKQARLLHVVFFATWCPPCVEELDGLAQFEARWSDSGYRLVLIAVENRHTLERLEQFVARRQPVGTMLFDAEGRAQRKLAADQLPTHLLLDAKGELLLRGGEFNDGLRRMVESTLGDSRRSGRP